MMRQHFFLLTQIYVSTFFLLTQHFFFRPQKQRFLARDPRLEVKPYSYSLPYTTIPAQLSLFKEMACLFRYLEGASV